MRQLIRMQINNSTTYAMYRGAAMVEHRQIARHRTYKAARIAFQGGRAVITCLVRNLSDKGACLMVDNPIGIPDSFTLVFDSGEASRASQVIWRKEKQIGVEFH